MFGSIEAAAIVIRELATIPVVSATLGDRVFFLPAVPRDAEFPCALIYPQITQYDQPINADGTPIQETVSLEVRLIDQGESPEGIYEAAKAQLGFLAGARYDEVIDGVEWHVRFEAVSEVGLPALIEDTTFYRQLGTVYTVEFYRGG